MRLRAALGIAVVAVIAVSGCTGSGADEPPTGADGSPTSEPAAVDPATVTLPVEPTAVLGGATPDALAVEASQTLFDQSPAAVLVAIGADPAGAAAIAVE